MIKLTGESLTIDEVVKVACRNDQIAPLSDVVQQRMQESQAWIEESILKEKIIYGINTGFGPLATTRIQAEQASKLSRNVILACLTGVGPPLSREMVRSMMIIRANTLAKGHSGVRPVVVQTLIDMLNAGVTPVIPCKGSLGASGDLAPLAHLAVVLTRDKDNEGKDHSGEAWFDGERLSGAEAMERAGIPRLVPQAKEGLALTNGTTLMVAAGALAVFEAENLLAHAEIAAAMSLEALTALSAALHPGLNEVNRMMGQSETADNIRKLIQGSGLIDSSPERIQDAYSLRCIPQVLGPVRHALSFIRSNFALVLNGATDNPLIFPDSNNDDSYISISGGNFHGQGPAMWLDFLGIIMAEVGNIAERRIFRMVSPELNNGLPSMLVKSPGLNTGLMMPQYTAAALVSDNKTLAHPDSVDSIPSSANQEDHVSMGANAARHTMEIIDNVRNIIAIEFLTAAQAIYLRPAGPEKLGKGTLPAYKIIRQKIPPLVSDRELSPDIEAIVELIQTDEILNAVKLA
jgi:histidine ammonia-lyase